MLPVHPQPKNPCQDKTPVPESCPYSPVTDWRSGLGRECGNFNHPLSWGEALGKLLNHFTHGCVVRFNLIDQDAGLSVFSVCRPHDVAVVRVRHPHGIFEESIPNGFIGSNAINGGEKGNVLVLGKFDGIAAPCGNILNLVAFGNECWDGDGCTLSCQSDGGDRGYLAPVVGGYYRVELIGAICRQEADHGEGTKVGRFFHKR